MNGILREVRMARRYFVGSQYHDDAVSLLEGLATDTPEQSAEKVRALPTEEVLFSRLTEKLAGKSVVKSLKRISEGLESPAQKSIALSSLLTHVLLETRTNKEYGCLISSVARALVESLEDHATDGALWEEQGTEQGTEQGEDDPATVEGGEESTLMSFGSGKYYYLQKSGDDLKIVDALGAVLKEGHGDVAAFVLPLMKEYGDMVSRDFLTKFGILPEPEIPPLGNEGEGPDGRPVPPAPGQSGGSHGGGGMSPSAPGALPAGEEPPQTEGTTGEPTDEEGVAPEGPVEVQPEQPETPAPEGEVPPEEPVQEPIQEPVEAPEDNVVSDEEAVVPEGEELTPEEKEAADRAARRATR